MLHLILFGPPGAGKGTQAAALVEKFHLMHISTGDLLRSEIAGQTTLGLQAKTYMDRGELVPDETVVGMICNQLENLNGISGIIYDGFPRTPKQSHVLEKILNPRGETINALISLEVPHAELVERLLNRGKTSGRSDDTSLETIENRIRVYHSKTKPLIDHYATQGKHIPVNGVGTIDEIASRLFEVIERM